MRNTPDPSDSYLDSKDLIRLLDEMEAERDSSLDELAEAIKEREAAIAADPDNDDELSVSVFTGTDGIDYAETSDWDGSREEEYSKLKSFIDEMEGYVSDWRYGVQLIAAEVWTKYAKECAEELHGRAIRDASWPFDCIDWDQAADRLQDDYTSGEWDGNTFWGRS